MSESPWSIRRPAPLLGQHNAEIFPTRSGARKGSSPRARVSPVGGKAAPPLAGTRVLDMTLVWAGPYCTTFLADLGAEVIRVESTQTMVPMTRGLVARPTEDMLRSQLLIFGGMPGRTPGARPWNRAPLFNAHARNKRSVTADLIQPKGIEVFKRLVKISDVFVENNATSTMEKLGISYEMLRSERPDIIMVRMPAYGSSGPYAGYRALGNHIEGVIGHSTVRGYPDMDPSTNTPVFVADAAAGAHGAFAVLAALNYRRRTGKGQLIELPLAESTLPYLGHFFMDYSMNGRSAGAIGNRHPYAVQGCYPCKGEDRWVCITIFDDRDWTALCGILGRPDLSRDSRFADQAGRYRNHDEIDQHIAEWTRLHDPREVMRVLQGDGLAAGPVMDQRDVFSDPHVIERGIFEEAYQEDTGTHWYTGAPYRMSETPCGVLRGPVRLGEDNDYVYKELLHVSDEEYGELEHEGHVGMDYDESVP